MEKYIIGLDLGINNVGWSVVDAQTNKIKYLGVKQFEASDSAKDRRTQRNTRRRLKRRETRKTDILKILSNINFPNNLTIDTMLIETRCKGINEQISKQDITNILCYMATHRGYIPFGDEEVSFVDLDGKYPCEYYYEMFKSSTNNKYRALRNTVKNEENINEVKKMLETQRKYYPEITNETIENIVTTLQRKRKFWEGPGSINALTDYGRFKTPEDVVEYLEKKKKNPEYEKYLFEDLIGKCSVIPNEKCASQINFYAEKFNLLNDFINISFKSIEELNNKDDFYETQVKTYKLRESGLNKVFDYCMSKDTLTIKGLFKDLFATTIDNISGYRQDGHDPNKPEMSTMNTFRTIRKTFKECNANMDIFKLENIDLYNEIINYMMLVPGQVELINMLSTIMPLSENDKEALKKVFKSKKTNLKYHSLCEKILIRACNDMLSLQKNYMQVYKLKDYGKESRKEFIKRYEESNKGEKLMNPTFIDDIISSPQVKKTLRQSVKVINEIIKNEKSLPDVIVVESTKDTLNSEKMRKVYIDINKKQKALHDKAIKTLSSIGYSEKDISKKKIEKLMLYEEFDGLCPYCNNQITLKYLINGSDEIEHILPRSDSFDDSFDNRTVSCANCNKNKNNQTPLEFLKGNEKESFIERIKSNKNISEFKKENFLFAGDISKYRTRFFNRNLRDTAYATKEMINQINIFNLYLESKNKDEKIKTLSTPGQITHSIRKRYDLEKDRDTDIPYHHAIDASILALLPTTKIGSKVVMFQNDNKFFLNENNKDKMTEIGLELKYYDTSEGKIEYDNYIADFKNINDTSNIFMYSPEVKKEPNKGLFNANMYKVIKIDDKYYKIDQINDIYNLSDSDKKLLPKLFDDAKNETLLCKLQHKEFYEKLKNIYIKYSDSKNSPFEDYQREINNLSKEDKFDYLKHGLKMSENAPSVKRLRYYTPISEPYLIDKKSINKKDGTYLAFDSLAQAGIEVYYNETKNCFAFVPIPSVCYNLKTRKVNREHKLYKRYKELNLKDYKVKYIVTLYNGNTIEVLKKDNTIIKGVVSNYHKTHDNIVLKNGSYFTKSDLEFSIIDYNPIGKSQKRLTKRIK